MRASMTPFSPQARPYLYPRFLYILNPTTLLHQCEKLAPDYITYCWTFNKPPHNSCCEAGNKCLQHNICYNAGIGQAYHYGCTYLTF